MDRVEEFTPESLDEVAALLLAVDETARPVFQGVELTARLGPPEGGSLVLNLSRVPELTRVEFDERDGLRIGSAVSLERLLAFPPIFARYHVFGDGLEECVARGDGSVTLAEALSRPAAVPGITLPLLSCRADVAVFGPYGWSELAVEALCQPGRQPLQFGEFAVHLSLPAPPVRSGCAYASHAPEGGARLAAAAMLVMEENLGTCCGARLLYSAVEGRPERAVESERFLAGRQLDDAALDRAAALAEEAVQVARMGGHMEPGVLGQLAAQVLRQARGRLAA